MTQDIPAGRNIIPIDQADALTLTLFHSRRDADLAHAFEPAPGAFIAESAKVSLRALAAGYEPIAVLVEEEQLAHDAQPLLAALKNIKAVPVYTASQENFLAIAGYPMTRGVLCAFRRKACPSVRELLAPFRAQTKSRIAVLDHVVNPANTGSIFRNAAALGFDAVILGDGTCDPLARRCLRVSMGTVLQLPWTRGDAAWITALKEMNYKTVAMALTEKTVPLNDPAVKAADKLAVILGNEGDGLSEEIISACDYTVKIPMQHGVDSLNVAAASAIAFWELRIEDGSVS